MGDSYRFKIGNFQCLAVNDGVFIGNADMLFANAPEEELRQVLQRYGLKPDHLPSSWTCLLVKTPTNIVLVDTGMGTGGEYGGQLLPLLHGQGFQPQEIDTVILDMVDTALHPVQIEYPEWYAQLDQFPEQTVATRQGIYQRAAEKNALVLAFHFSPFPSLGHIIKRDERWKWQPAQR